MTASIISDICIVSKTNDANLFILKNKCLSAFLSGIPFPLASFPFFSFLHNYNYLLVGFVCLLDTDYFSNLGIRLALSLISCSIFICMQYLLFMQLPKIQFHKDTMSLKRNLVQSNVETELLGALKQSQRTHVCCNALLCLSVHLTSSVQLDYLL